MIAETDGISPGAEVIHKPAQYLQVGIELVDRAHVNVNLLQAEVERLNSVIEQQQK